MTDISTIFAHTDDEFPTRLGLAILNGKVPRSRLRDLAREIYLQEKWPSHIAHVYLNLDEAGLADPDVIRYIVDVIRAENLGVGSHGRSHSELAADFAHWTGITRRGLERATPSVANRALMDWCDMSALERPWLEALTVQAACEGRTTLMHQIQTGLARHYAAPERALRFFAVHSGRLERAHARRALRLIQRHVTTMHLNAVGYAYRMSVRLLTEFYDSLAE